MDSPLLDELVFSPNQTPGQENTAIIPLLKIAGINHAIAIGPGSENMAESFNFDSSDLVKKQTDFLSQNGFAPFTTSYISSVPRPGEALVTDIEKRNETGHALQIPAEGMFTKISNVPLIHKPADCPTAILSARDATNQPILGLIHLGRPQVNKRVTEQALEHLENKYGVDLTTLTIGITPSIGPKHYVIKQADQDTKHLIDETYWGMYAQKDSLEGVPLIRVDVLGKILSILTTYGVPNHQIQAYGHNDSVDTYFLASQQPRAAFSHRFATATGQPEKNGRIMVACQV